ncbi:MAG: rod shape-determining protein MreC [bacterium]|nr:rod shape-determining protein MreC [bacterium]
MSISGFLERFRHSLKLLLLLVVSLVLMTLHAGKEQGIQKHLTFLFEITAWMESGLSQVALGAREAWSGYFRLVHVKEENRALMERVALLENKLHEQQEVKLENERLRKLLAFQESVPFTLLPSKVIGKGFNSWSRTLLINQGRSAGVVEGMAVVRPEGVVGRVLTVSPNFSLVQLIIDSNSDIPAIFQRTRAEGIVEGKISNQCRVKYLNRIADVQEGDIVISSGLGGVYPKGLIVGSVFSVQKKPYGLFQEVIITPAVDFSRMEEVFVVRNDKFEEYGRLMKRIEE